MGVDQHRVGPGPRGGLPYGEGQHPILLEDGPPGPGRDGVAVAEAAHTPHTAEVVVERPVLLHDEDDVPDVGQVAGRHRPFQDAYEGRGE
jgi:hypothetical protein